MSLDLKNLDSVAACSEGAEVELRHFVTGDGLGIFIKVLGPDSPEYRAAQHKGQNETLARAQRQRKSIDFEAIEARAVDVLASVTLGWRDGESAELTIDGEQYACTKANAKRLYTEYPWIKEQVDAFIADRGNFTKA